MNNTKNGGVLPLMALAAMTLLAFAPKRTQAELVMEPKHIGAYVDYGQALNEDDKQALNRTGVYLTVSGTHDERLQVTATLGGLFWYGFPELPSSSRLIKFGPGVGQAQAVYSFGEDPGNPTAKLQFGLFPLKYNSDAANLGEYLYRSGTYPGYVWNGGWSYINSASHLLQGARLTIPTFGGKVTHDITLHMERDVAQPLHDFSPGYMITAKPNNFVEVGAGFVWSNAISFKPSRLAPKKENNAYVKSTGLPVKGLTDFNISACSSPVATQRAFCFQDTAAGVADTVAARATFNAWQDCQTNGNCSDIDYYTFRGVKTMARVSLDFGRLLAAPVLRPGDLKVYSEVAMLGVENQPFYYEDPLERMPIMVGVNVPTLGLFDRLAVELEYRKSRFKNTFRFPYDNLGGLPIPLADGGESPYGYTDQVVDANEDKFTRDDVKWSVYATRKVTKGITLTAQFASDNLRPANGEAKPSSEPFAKGPSEWYYVVRAGFGF